MLLRMLNSLSEDMPHSAFAVNLRVSIKQKKEREKIRQNRLYSRVLSNNVL